MNARQPESTSSPQPHQKAFILYDGSCGLCSASARRLKRFCDKNGFALLPLQSDQARQLSGWNEEELMKGLAVVLPDGGGTFQGVPGFIQVGRRVWYLKPWAAVAGLPGVQGVLELIYSAIVRHRRRISTVCHFRPDINE